MRVVLDTNVVVSGFLSEHGAPARVLDLFVSSDIAIVVDGRILAEYADVLRRPAFGFNDEDVSAFLRLAERAERVVGVPLPFGLPDEDDEPFLEVAVAGGVDALVTGNVRHFRIRGRLAIPILTPREFLKRLAAR